MATCAALWPALSLADATVPTKDIPGSKDSPALKRYDGSFIVSYTKFSYTDFKVSLANLEPTDQHDVMTNQPVLPKQEKELEGVLTRLVYLIPADRSPSR
ncbi:hypothetical protein G3T14_13655 [Methylobacterium sp. BTF04]|uniref:hypothetical protein n=1 Tax=Methylobacterium sp. BTF04 TaxID=2708300 RepID=UPI0013CFAA40|nr:hypothetical protein [Methylobacterium sp. BTF04]NEU13174.1 hypothetical protein [Methylobacterium sp. BTF04]